MSDTALKVTKLTNSATRIGGRVYKYSMSILFAFIIFLILVVIGGRILNMINNTTCSDKYIKTAHTWSSWMVGISSAGALITLALFVLLFFV